MGVSLIDLDHLFMALAALSGGLWVYYGVMRFGAEEKRRKPVFFWRDIFLMATAILGLRFSFQSFPGLHPDTFFLALVAASGALFAFFWWNKRREMAAFWRDLFVCFLLVFAVRGFFVDYFRIPSGSMKPTLAIGDVVLTDKNAYGYRLPILGWRLSDGTPPARGDVVVFRNREDKIFLIKRIIGVPGDEVRIQGGSEEVYIDGKALALQTKKDEAAEADGKLRLREQMPSGGWHDIYKKKDKERSVKLPDKTACRKDETEKHASLICKVPEGRYFVMGDNRDDSHDSRFWGFVDKDKMVGPAFRILFNYQPFFPPSLQIFDSFYIRWWLPLALEEK